MKKIYCNEGQLTAAVTIEGVRYETENPPLTVITGNFQVYTIIVNPDYIKTFILYPDSSNRYGRIEIMVDNNTPNTQIFRIYRLEVGSYIDSNGRLVGDYALLDTLTYTDFSVGHLVGNEVAGYTNGLYATDNAGQIICASNDVTNYEVKCDGCLPDECKGEVSQYPGYLCLPCEEMQKNLKGYESRLKIAKGIAKSI